MKSKAWRDLKGVLAVLPMTVLPACIPTEPSLPSEPGAPPPVVIDGPFRSLVLNGFAYPAYQFHEAEPDRCDARHYHASGVVYSIGRVGTLGSLADKRAIACHEGHQFPGISDPAAGSCGFGRVGEVIVMEVYVELPCAQAFRLVAPPPPVPPL